MTSVPYPSFVHHRPVDVTSNRAALSAVGRCRIFPESCTSRHNLNDSDLNKSTSNQTENDCIEDYLAIVAKNVLQAQVDHTNKADDTGETDAAASNVVSSTTTTTTTKSTTKEARDKLKKRYMKEGVAMAQRYLKDALQVDASIVHVEMVVRAEDLMETHGCLASCLLDAGCQAIVTDGTHLEAMDVCQIPRERMVAHFTLPFTTADGDLIQAMQAASNWASCVSVEFTKGKAFSMEAMHQITQFAIGQHTSANSSGEDVVAASSNNNNNNKVQVVLQFRPQDCLDNHMTDEELAKLVGMVCRKLKNHAGTVTLVDPTARQMGLAYAACLVTDRKDELYTTVVCTRNGEALGLVYSSQESIVAALESGRGVYYSRSRKGLWRKGDTSGHYQTLHRMDIDCDGDALRFTVTQRGDDHAAFCHLNTLTCWGPSNGLRHLEETLQQRLKDAPAGSYTKRLFDDADLLRNKLVEEAQELAEATDKDDVAGELADVLYFAMVRAVKAGVSMDDAVQELDRRTRKVTRRQGDSKAFRIEAGKAILEEAAAKKEGKESM